MSDSTRKTAKKSDWKTFDMPRNNSRFTINRKLTDADYENLKYGFIPQETDDRWFWYFADNKLFLHRKSGICIYILSFTPGSDEIDVIANRDPQQYSCTDDETDADFITQLLAAATAPLHDYCHELLSEALDSIDNKLYAVTSEHLIVNGAMHDAVFFHKPDEPNGFLSNWWLSDFELDGLKFTSVEQYLMCRKCMTFGDIIAAKAVMATDDTARQQAIARNARGYNDIVWNGLRQVVLMRGLIAKFMQNDAMKNALLDTGDAYLVECAKSDRLWACGVSLYDKARENIADWQGKNILGFTLMEVRTMFKKTAQNSAPQKKSEIFVYLDDITTLSTDCIVNAANKSLLGGGGVDGAIHRAAGPDLLKECKTLHGCNIGEAKITKGYQLKAPWVIHTVGPVFSGKPSDATQLAECYRNTLELAKKHNIRSIAFPSISTGAYGYPLGEAVPIAVQTVAIWLRENSDYFMDVIFCCLDQKTYDVYQTVLAEKKQDGQIKK